MANINGVIYDWNEENKDNDGTEYNITASPESIWVTFKGYGSAHSAEGDWKNASLVKVEKNDGVIHIVVWSDIDDGDPTHIISLKDAIEKNSHQTD